jgi:hypothetical protein
MPFEATEASPASDEIAEVTAPAEIEATDANPAESSTVDEGAKEPVDLLSVVKSAVEKPAEAAESPAAEGEVEAEAEVPPEGETEAEDDADLPFHNHPRFKQLVSERNEFREGHEQYGRITGFMSEHGLSGEEFSQGMGVMAAIKSGDPTLLGQARDYFQNGLQILNERLGHVLPDDLRERVEDGLIDEDTARELAQSRAAETLRTTQAEEREAADSQAEEVRARTALATSLATAVDGWERATKAADPDYSRKAELVETMCHAIVKRTGQVPDTAEKAVALAKEAYAEVNRQFKALLPPRRPIETTPRGSSTPTKAEPKSLREAIAQAANSGR